MIEKEIKDFVFTNFYFLELTFFSSINDFPNDLKLNHIYFNWQELEKKGTKKYDFRVTFSIFKRF